MRFFSLFVANEDDFAMFVLLFADICVTSGACSALLSLGGNLTHEYVREMTLWHTALTEPAHTIHHAQLRSMPILIA